MIKFKSVLWRNFLSTGNAGTLVRLDGAPTTLVIGKNGHGKSTLLDALCFGLYGKPFRNVNKNQLINSINGKGALVEVEFETDGKNYKIRRGIKPNIFEVFVDGNLITQDAAIKDYQKTLEKQILKMNHKTFTQVVILGSSSFTPFMKLSAGHRREVIEDILDIKIFSTMSAVLKEKVAETKSELDRVETDTRVLKGQVVSQKNLVDMLKKSKDASEKELRTKIDNARRRIEALRNDKDVANGVIAQKQEILHAYGDPDSEVANYRNWIKKTEKDIDNLLEQIDFFKDNHQCPECRQDIDDNHKGHMTGSLENLVETNKSMLDNYKELLDQVLIKATEANNLEDEIRQLQIDASSYDTEIRTINKQIGELEVELAELDEDTADLDAERTKLKDLAAQVTAKLEDKIQLTEKRNLQEVASTLLKDSGIKTKVIREYLPLMNKLVNKYLQAQDSFIQFELDEEFNETIKSRHRDEFSYTSFSEGERQRIDLAILFTWRQIARLKNSANTNLLILDEIMDGSLDAEGNDTAQALIDMLAADGTHVYVVTHSVDQHADKFDRVLKFEKKADFSVMSELK